MAAADDQILGAAGDVDLAMRADPPEGAAAQPPIVERLRFRRAPEITRKHLRSPDNDLAGRRRRAEMDLVANENGDFGERGWHAGRSKLLRAIMRGLRDRAGKFRHAVDLAQAVAGPQREEAFLDLWRTDRSADDAEAQPAEVGAIHRGIRRSRNHGGNAAAQGDALLRDDAPMVGDHFRIAETGRGRDHDRPTRPKRRQAGAERAADME